MDNLDEMKRWVQQYKDDQEETPRLAQSAAIAAMDGMLDAWRHGLNGPSIKAALVETSRMLQILNAFQGKLAIMDCMVNGIPDDGEI